MKLYHGSKKIIEKPKVKGSYYDNDYGPAFYLTRDLSSAHEWACKNNSVGYVNKYSFNIVDLKVLDLTDKEQYSVLNWLAILLHYRTLGNDLTKQFAHRLKFIEEHYYIDVNQFDVVIGYRADDAYFRFPSDFVKGNITLEQLEQSYNFGNLGVQFVLISEKAINRLKFEKAILSEQSYVDKYFQGVKRATTMFDDLDKDAEGTRIIDIIREFDK